MHTSVEVNLFRSEDGDNQELHIFPLKFLQGAYFKEQLVCYELNSVSAASESQSMEKEQVR